jgi:hypothetical protein
MLVRARRVHHQPLHHLVACAGHLEQLEGRRNVEQSFPYQQKGVCQERGNQAVSDAVGQLGKRPDAQRASDTAIKKITRILIALTSKADLNSCVRALIWRYT